MEPILDQSPDPVAAAKAPDARGQLEITASNPSEGVVVIRLVGELDVAVTDDLSGALTKADESRPKLIVLDLGELGFMDSSGFHVLTTAHKRTTADGRGFVIANPRYISHALTISGLASFFLIEPDVETALATHDGDG